MSGIVNDTRDRIEAEALDWTIRVQRSDFADWDALTDWIDADPRHADRFNRLSSKESLATDLLRQMPPPSRPVAQIAQVVPFRRRSIMALSRPLGLIAASLLLVVTVTGGWMAYQRFGHTPETALVTLATRQGETRDIRLPDGTQIALGSATRLSIDAVGRHVKLDHGRAMFSVTHEPDHPFSVQLGDVTVTDVGTVFDVRRDDGAVSVGVAQGEVRVEASDQSVPLKAGYALNRAAGRALRVNVIDPATVGGWRRGEFSYDDVAISDIVADIEAVTGASIRTTPAIAGRRFAGSIHVVADPGQTLRTAAPMLGVTVVRDGGVWVLGSPSGPSQR